MKISRFEELDCWKEARVLVQCVYEATKDGLTIRRMKQEE